jgi:hypothetical protein
MVTTRRFQVSQSADDNVGTTDEEVSRWSRECLVGSQLMVISDSGEVD